MNNSVINKTQNKFERFKDPLTRQDVEVVVKKTFGSNVKLINYHTRSYSEEKVGFMGNHRHLVVTIQNEHSAEMIIHTFFLKSIPYDIENQATLIKDSNIFYKEINFYRHIMPELMKEAKEKSWCAQCYLVKDDLIVFEDLQFRNYTLKGKLLDIIALKSALTSLAKLHASSLLAEKRLGKSFLDLHPKVLEECLFKPKGEFAEWFRSGVDAVIAVAKSLSLDHTCIPKVCHRIFDKFSTSKTRRNVICHGDAWGYNLMFDNSQPLPNCILVDFQLIRYVPTMADVVQLLYLTMRRKFREKNETSLLKHYHESFCAAIRERDQEMDLPDIDDIFQEYEEFRVAGIVTAAIYCPINLIEGKKCAELTKDSDGFTNLFGYRTDLVLDTMKNDSDYRERLTEIVTEIVQNSKQLLES